MRSVIFWSKGMDLARRAGESSDVCNNAVVVASRKYRVSIEAAFEAWTDPAKLEQWFGPPGFRARVLTYELAVGGAWRFLMEGPGGACFHHFGTFVRITRPLQLVFTWASEEMVEGWRDENGNPTLVTVDFKPLPLGVNVTIAHERLSSIQARAALDHGWTGSLICLETVLGDKEEESDG